MTPDRVPLIELRELVRCFPGVIALDAVSLELFPGTIHALLGENGAGKSTLINILSGVLRPDAGDFRMRGSPVHPANAHAARALGIATVHQEADLFPDLTIAENLAFEHGWTLRGGFIDWPRLRRLTREALRLQHCSLDPDRLAASLTAAERQLLGIAAALSRDSSVLILDEPTSSLSAAEVQILFTQLKQFRAQGGAVLYVSHRLEEVFLLADVVTVLRDGKKVWSGSLGETSPDKLIAWMVGREILDSADSRARKKEPSPIEETSRLVCSGLTAADGSFRDISLEVRAAEVLGLYGLIGAGRSEWAQGVFGLRPLAGGAITLNGKLYVPRSPGDAARHGLAYLPEDRLRFGLFANLSVRANTVIAALHRLSFGPFVSARTESRQAAALTHQLSVRLRSLLQPAGTLSGGNQQKVVLGRWLACAPETLILDEPTRGVDVGAKKEIHRLLRQLADAGHAVVLISSDLPEVLAQSDRVGVFRHGRLVALYEAASTTAEQVGAAALPSAGEPAAMGERQPAARNGRDRSRRLGEWLREAGLLAAVIVLASLLAWRTDTFWRAGTLRDVAENAALLALCGLAAAVVILAGGIDISFGSLLALSAATAGYLMQNKWPPLVAVPAALVVGTAGGALNAALTLLGRVHPIVVTLGMMSVYRGLTLLLIGEMYIHDIPDGFRAPFQSAPLGIPAAAWLALFAMMVAWLALGWTVPGRQVFALGSNPTAAQRTGISRTRVWLAVFSLEGLLAGVAGLLALGLMGHLHARDFEETTLEAIGVAVVGGIAITGGRGSVWGICAAALLFRVLEKGWVLLDISRFWQRTIVGSLLLLAILMDRFWRLRSRPAD
ncbi:MAG TPA: ATP-binding cassette domain-containing protein [Gemmataceae bacterium]|nr:ATP-binding cassette domain-containing protein [Gemmataceae bacterium]